LSALGSPVGSTGNIRGVAAAGATALASSATSRADRATKPTPLAAYPPIPLFQGETTPSMNPAATAASKALPPCRKTAAPTSAAARLGATQSARPRADCTAARPACAPPSGMVSIPSGRLNDGLEEAAGGGG